MVVLSTLLLLTVLLAVLAVNRLEHWQPEMEQILSRSLNAKVELAGIKGHWRGIYPVVNLQRLSIYKISSGNELSVLLPEATVELDIRASAKAFGLVFSQLDLKGLVIDYQIPEAEKSRLKQDSAIDPTATKKTAKKFDLLAFLLMQPEIKVEYASIRLRQDKRDLLKIAPIQLMLAHDTNMHQLSINAEIQTQDRVSDAIFIAESIGKPSKYPVNFFFKTDGLSQQSLNPWLEPLGIELTSATVSQAIWGQTKFGKIIYLRAKTKLNAMQYEDYKVSQLELDTTVLRHGQTYQLQLGTNGIDTNQTPFSLPYLNLDFKRSKTGIKLTSLAIKTLNLQKLKDLLINQPFIDKETTDILRTLSPQGQLNNIQFKWGEDSSLQDFKLTADMANIGINAWTDVPEIKGINGLLVADKQGGKLHLNSQKFDLYISDLFLNRWQYDKAEGVIGWQLKDRGVQLTSQLLKLENSALAARGRFSIYLPYSKDEQPLLGLQVGMENVSSQQIKYYLPPWEIGEETYQWLVNAIQGGQIKQAGFVLNGVTRMRLPNYQSPAVLGFFNIENADFAYQLGWPTLKGSDTFVFLHNGEILAEAKGGKIYNSDIEYAWGYVPSTTDKLYLAGRIKGNAKDGQQLLTKTPLKAEIGDDLNNWKMAGQATTDIKIKLPLYSNKRPDVRVVSKISGGRFSSQDEPLDFTKIKGTLRYDTNKGIYAKQLTGVLFGEPVSATISNTDKNTVIEIKGSIGTQALKAIQQQNLLELIKGKLKYLAKLTVCPDGSCHQLEINTDLVGVALELPSPFGKEAAQKSNLLIQLVKENQGDRIQFNLNNQLQGIILTKNNQLDRVRLSLNSNAPMLPNEKGIWIEGNLDKLDYQQLDDFLQKVGLTGLAANKTTNEPILPLKKVELNIADLNYSGMPLGQLYVKLQPEPDGWMLNMDGTAIAGRCWFPNEDKQPIMVDLERLKINRSDLPDTAEEDKPAKDKTKLEQLPAIDFKVKQLILDGLAFGSWQFAMRPVEHGNQLNNIKANIEGSKLQGTLSWLSQPTESTSVTMTLNSEDFNKALKLWKQEDSMEVKKLDASLQLLWQGSPLDYKVSKIDGSLSFKAKQGRIMDVGRTANILRIFGILNLQSLGRRLRLDFSDLTKSGVSFDRMEANYQINKGIAQTLEPFIMTGPSANVAMQGTINLVDETMNNELEVALPITDNIPIVSVLLGAPQVAGAVFLLDKIIGDPLAKLTTVRYKMSGKWDEPEIKIHGKGGDKTPLKQRIQPPVVESRG